MLRVYHREHAGRPIRVVWTLEELERPYELTTMSSEEGRGEQHLGRHPLGRVPVLEDDEGTVFESAAICLHLADSDPQGRLIAAPGSHDRALIYQWASFAPAEMEQPLIESAMQAERDPERAAAARRRFDATSDVVASALADRDYLVADRFTVADVLVGTTLGFTSKIGGASALPANLQSYVARLGERPAYARALERTSG